MFKILMAKNIRNKILSRKEIEEEGNRKMEELLSKYPKREHSTLLRFTNEVTKLNMWLSEKREKLEKSKK